MSDTAYRPTPQEARSRQTAMEAERHWWVQSLRTIRDQFAREVAQPNHGSMYAAGRDEGLSAFIAQIDRLIAERSR